MAVFHTVRQALNAAAQAQHENRLSDAADCLAQALDLHESTGEPLPPSSVFILAKLHYEAGRHAKAAAVALRGLAKRPDDFDLNNLLGVCFKNLRRLDEALVHLDRACRAAPARTPPYINKGNVFLAQGNPQGAVDMFTQAVRLEPKSGECHRLLGLSRHKAGNLSEARRCLERACQLAPGNLTTFLDLIFVLEESGQGQEAEDLAEKALRKFGPRPLLVRHRAKLLRRHARHQAALDWLKSLVDAGSRDPAVYLEAAHTVKVFSNADANPWFARALELAPEDPEILTSFSESLQRTRGPDEGQNIQQAYELALRRLALGGDLRECSQKLFSILIRCADFASLERVGTFAALGACWAGAGAITALHGMMPLVKSPQDRRDLLAWHRGSVAEQEAFAARTPLPSASATATTRTGKVRVGFLSADLRNHPVSYFVAPFIERYDRARFELYCYSGCTHPADTVQRHLATRVDAFRQVPDQSARQTAALIQADQVDVLFELGGATAMNKVEIMAWRPAKRQASWLGYPHSAGYAAIDRILTDPYLEPPDLALLLEKPFQLAHSWVAFEGLGFGQPPAINPLTPHERTGRITFGTMNNPYKYNPGLLDAWAEVLLAVPGSRFLFVRPEGAVPAFRANLERLFAARGVDPARLSYVPVRGAHLPYYNDLDVALDTFPQTGGTTTCESLWMGVPTVSLAGECFFERLSHSNLHNSGLGELSAASREAYVAKAVEISQATAWRTELRRTARERLRAHPLGNPALFTRDFEDALTAWMDEPAP